METELEHQRPQDGRRTAKTKSGRQDALTQQWEGLKGVCDASGPAKTGTLLTLGFCVCVGGRGAWGRGLVTRLAGRERREFIPGLQTGTSQSLVSLTPQDPKGHRHTHTHTWTAHPF